jgi:hypothetical protein
MPKKRSKRSLEDVHEEEATAKHSSLFATTTKTFHREAKAAKAQECQKIVRKIKFLKGSSESKGENSTIEAETPQMDDKAARRMDNLDEKLRYTKAFSINEIERICLRRVGLQNTDAAESVPDDQKEDDLSKKYKKDLVDSMLRQKKLSSAMQSASEKVSAYNIWLSRREEQIRMGGKSKNKNNKSTGQSRGTKRGRDTDFNDHGGNSALFIDSLNGSTLTAEEEEYAFGMSYEGDQEIKKKNRPGQRARKMKAMAIEAKKAGRVWDSNNSWREKKAKPEDKKTKTNEHASGLDKSKKINVAEVASMGQNWKEEGKAHPSWAAREAQKAKSGISQFAGKKITFD